jgi:hypothetical protein
MDMIEAEWEGEHRGNEPHDQGSEIVCRKGRRDEKVRPAGEREGVRKVTTQLRIRLETIGLASLVRMGHAAPHPPGRVGVEWVKQFRICWGDFSQWRCASFWILSFRTLIYFKSI